ncbi:MAG: heme ABC exporter ATP-binding protein CcmA [Candidatus Binatia bacterium]
MPTALEIDQVSKRFGLVAAVNEVSCSIAAGEAVLLLGANGAGKTTLLRLCATLLRPTRGHIRIAGLDAAAHGAAARRKLAVLGHESFLYPDLSAAENLSFYARLYGVSEPHARAAALIEQLGLRGWAHRAVRTFSRGMVQRCALARVLLHEPEILLLDEPFTGLDVEARELSCGALRDAHGRGAALLISTHDLQLGLSLCARAIILARGRIAWQGPVTADEAPALERRLRELAFREPA